MDSTTQQQEQQQEQVSLKISFNNDFRRVSVPRTIDFTALLSTVNKLFSSTITNGELENLVIRYQDDESDWITISSDAELEEAVSQVSYESPILRLTLYSNNKRKNKANNCHKNNFNQHQPRHPAFSNWFSAFQHLQQQQQQEQEQEQQQQQQQEHCRWKHRFGSRAKYFYLHKVAIALMENGTKSDIETARAIFHEQLNIHEHATPLYNIACCEALLGNSENALNFLRKSVSAGYRDVNHIQNDEDLKSLRNLDGFISIIEALKQDNNNNDKNNNNNSNVTQDSNISSNSSTSNSTSSSLKSSKSNTNSSPSDSRPSIRIPIIFSTPKSPEPVPATPIPQSSTPESLAPEVAPIEITPENTVIIPPVAAQVTVPEVAPVEIAPVPPVIEIPPVVIPPIEPTVPIVAPTAPEPVSPTPLEAALIALGNMGFSDRVANEQALARARLNVPLAVQFLLEQQYQ